MKKSRVNQKRIQRRVMVLMLSMTMIVVSGWTDSVQAYDCVLDTNGDGIGDGTAGANSSNNSLRVACGNFASAASINSTALGYFASAAGVSSTAIGRTASAAGIDSTALGVSASAAEVSSTALGAFASAAGDESTSLGRSASAAGVSSTALGAFASATGDESTSLGRSASAAGFATVALGQSSSADGPLSTALGQNSDVDINSSHAIAIGEDAKIINAPGGIAIGSDFNNVDTGATATATRAIAVGANSAATQPGAIALGANVVADKANTMTVGVPIEIVRDDGSSNILVEENNATVAVRTLGELANNGGVRLRFNNTALGEEWDFTSNQTGGFQFSLVGSGGAELSVGTNGTVRMGPGPISNLSLFPSGNMTIEGVLTENSDRDSKQDITELDHESILDKVSALSIHEWEYKDSPDQRHIGPMAQDFYETFQLGNDNTHIATLDLAGVALASIQALKQENKTTQLKLAEKDQEIAELKQQMALVLTMIGSQQFTETVTD